MDMQAVQQSFEYRIAASDAQFEAHGGLILVRFLCITLHTFDLRIHI